MFGNPVFVIYLSLLNGYRDTLAEPQIWRNVIFNSSLVKLKNTFVCIWMTRDFQLRISCKREQYLECQLCKFHTIVTLFFLSIRTILVFWNSTLICLLILNHPAIHLTYTYWFINISWPVCLELNLWKFQIIKINFGSVFFLFIICFLSFLFIY